MLTHHGQGNLQKKEFIGGLQSPRAGLQNYYSRECMAAGVGMVLERWPRAIHKQKAETAKWERWSFWHLKTCTQRHAFSCNALLTNPSQQFYWRGAKYSNIWACGYHSHSKHLTSPHCLWSWYHNTAIKIPTKMCIVPSSPWNQSDGCRFYTQWSHSNSFKV